MAKICINRDEDLIIEGKFSVSQTLDETQTPPVLVIRGTLQTEKYIKEVESIESARYMVDGVNVYQEAFGSDDNEIIYNFTASSIVVKE